MEHHDPLDDYESDADRESRIDELEQRIEDLEQVQDLEQSGYRGREAGLSLGYALGMALATVLSWSRNASILWCILHGLFSWGYVIYFAFTR